MVGADYILSDGVSIGAKARWVQHGAFHSGDREWDQIRSHGSDNGPGMPTVTYAIETDDLSVFGVRLVMRYRF